VLQDPYQLHLLHSLMDRPPWEIIAFDMGFSSDATCSDAWDMFVRVQKIFWIIDIGGCEAWTPEPGCHGAPGEVLGPCRYWLN
jgi:hypothetical protein